MKFAKKLAVLMMGGIMMIATACGGTGTTEPKPIDPSKYLPDAEKGYQNAMGLRYTIADFQYGTEIPYNRYTNLDAEAPSTVKDAYHARYFRDYQPEYNYTPSASKSELAYGSTSTWSDPAGDNSNYFTIYPAEGGTKDGTVTVDYLTYIRLDNLSEKPEYTNTLGWSEDMFAQAAEKENVLNLSAYETLTVRMKAERETVVKLSMRDRVSGKVHDLGAKTLKAGEAADMSYDITGFAERTGIEYFRFEFEVNLDDNETNRIDFYRIEASAAESLKGEPFSLGGLTVESEYLGNMLYTKWGAYSASGFYDSEEKKWKVWFGAGIPETVASDNVYYSECEDLTQSWSKPIRVKLEDHGLLFPPEVGPGYGGDPSVIKVDGTYYMYFSGLATGLDDGRNTHWNKVYVATSNDGINWTMEPTPVVDAETSGGAGYGAGSPSTVYVDGTFYMYYYTQTPEVDNLTGFLRKESKDGIHFGDPVLVETDQGAGDVKYIPSLRKWVMVYYTVEAGEKTFDQCETVRFAVSDDGILWTKDESVEIKQNDFIPSCHNPGFLGNELGQGYETMFVTYGANDIPLVFMDGAQYDARQLEWSRITLQ